MAKLYNLARMSTATTGTGTITLGSAISGFLTFAGAGVADGETVSYGISDGANSEVGTGVYTASGTTLTRSVTKSTNSDAAINLSGNAQVFITARAEDLKIVPTPQGRLTLSSGTAITTSDVSGTTLCYYTPGAAGNLVPIYDGSSYVSMPFTELSNDSMQSSTGKAGPVAVAAQTKSMTCLCGMMREHSG
jgi:hypothetical protein